MTIERKYIDCLCKCADFIQENDLQIAEKESAVAVIKYNIQDLIKQLYFENKESADNICTSCDLIISAIEKQTNKNK